MIKAGMDADPNTDASYSHHTLDLLFHFSGFSLGPYCKEFAEWGMVCIFSFWSVPITITMQYLKLKDIHIFYKAFGIYLLRKLQSMVILPSPSFWPIWHTGNRTIVQCWNGQQPREHCFVFCQLVNRLSVCKKGLQKEVQDDWGILGRWVSRDWDQPRHVGTTSVFICFLFLSRSRFPAIKPGERTFIEPLCPASTHQISKSIANLVMLVGLPQCYQML